MATLYELTGQAMNILAMIDTAQAEDAEMDAAEMIDALDCVWDSIKDKAEGYAKAIRNFEADIAGIEAEYERLGAMMKARKNAVALMKDRLRAAMDAVGEDHIDTPIGRWSIRTGPWSVQITDEAMIPQQFRIPQPDKIDRAGISKAFRTTGEIVPGTEMTRGESLMFR